MLCIYVYFPLIVIKRTCLIHTGFFETYVCYSPAGRSDPYWDLGETVPEVLSTASGGTQTEGTVSPNTDRPRR